MKKQFKKSIAFAVLFLSLFSISASANPLKKLILMGEVKKVEECKDTKSVKVLVDGYLKGCNIYKGEIILIINKDTKVYTECNNGKKCESIKCEVGDYISASLDEKMTKSNPPQVNAKRIHISKVKDRAEKETSVADNLNEKEEKKDEKKVEE
ncbi:hypothetical protein [Clostridium sp. Ade.TY]|uniref:hypothetical protein n=1 Tax=Clostridium sp. Ade.TY TaxID=1391647 RepID=UPI000403BB85|nr:hypothetical protein [Clostridium sp. Ade.TY]